MSRPIRWTLSALLGLLAGTACGGTDLPQASASGQILRDSAGGYDVIGIRAAGDESTSGYDRWSGSMANVAFVSRKTGRARLLLHQAGYIKRFQRLDLGSKHSLYLFAAALKDTNSDGRIDADDLAAICVATRDGASFWVLNIENAEDWDFATEKDDPRVYVRQVYRRKGSFSSAPTKAGKLYVLSADLKSASQLPTQALFNEQAELERAAGRTK